ncbi:MAG: hypothetical protein M5U01_12755 [Ardenticatenaceae bacterium]|nr:hypothetical protein [Ardenticatenaceae bacterium]
MSEQQSPAGQTGQLQPDPYDQRTAELAERPAAVVGRVAQWHARVREREQQVAELPLPGLLRRYS